MLDDRPYMRDNNPHAERWSTSVRLIVVIAAVFVLQLISNLISTGQYSLVDRYLALNAGDPPYFWIWQVITFQFLHDTSSVIPLHLLLNCAMIYIFGKPLEEQLGSEGFLKLYFSGGVIGGLLQILLSLILPGHFGTVSVLGASAGVFALMAAFAVLHKEQTITALLFFIIPVSMKAKYLLLVLGVLACLGLLQQNSGIAHGAHLGGLLMGMIYVRYFAFTKFAFSWSSEASKSSDFIRMPRRRNFRAKKAKMAQSSMEETVAVITQEEFISKEVDPILDKISQNGIHSLTDRERKILEDARSRMSR